LKPLIETLSFEKMKMMAGEISNSPAAGRKSSMVGKVFDLKAAAGLAQEGFQFFPSVTFFFFFLSSPKNRTQRSVSSKSCQTQHAQKGSRQRKRREKRNPTNVSL
jgi:hypothetical protein